MIEAMACGTPVIAWRNGSMPEVIDDGVTGFVVDNLDGDVQAVDRVDTLSRLQCRQQFETRFDARRMASSYLDVYRQLANSGFEPTASIVNGAHQMEFTSHRRLPGSNPPLNWRSDVSGRDCTRIALHHKRTMAGRMADLSVKVTDDKEHALARTVTTERVEGGPHHILATSSSADERTRVLKHADTFAVFDHYGDIKPDGLGDEGVYHQGTRHLSCFVLDLEGRRPSLLNSAIRDENDQLTVTLTNPDMLRNGAVWAPLGTLHIELKKFLWQSALYQQLRVKNHGLESIKTSLALHFAADYADIFEVRGMKRSARGADLPAELTHNQVVLAYHGLDGILRRTVFQFSSGPWQVTENSARLNLSLKPQRRPHFTW